MPTLHWIGKEKVVNHHQQVPYRVLEHQYGFTATDGEQKGKETGSGNKIIHGDNLEALKALLPEYEGRVNCIYIDPPYNTGNEGWVYNDNVNDPKIKKWLHQVVGKDGEDLSRHDKWLCMMYPRLKLLHKLLADTGIIFISIDDNEQENLKYLCNEIFGRKNFLTQFSWKTEGNFDNQARVKINHEYILAYFKKESLMGLPVGIDPNIPKTSKLYKDEIRNTLVKNGPKNPISEVELPIGFPCAVETLTIAVRSDSWPHYMNEAIVNDHKLSNKVIVKSGWSSKDVLIDFINNNCVPVLDTKDQVTSFEISKTGAIEMVKKRNSLSHVISTLNNLSSTQAMGVELKKIGINFTFPKPNVLIEYLISLYSDQNSIFLDSFSGSGTTAHAVLNLNKRDRGNRKFILIEMEDYAETITAERIKRVSKGYGDVDGTGGAFDYYTLGESMFDEHKMLNENVALEKIRQYVYYTETQQRLTQGKQYQKKDNIYLLDIYNSTGYYFYYEKNDMTTLNNDFLATIKTKADQYVIYADNCLLSKEFMLKKNIVFKKIPRDITRF